VPLVYRNSLIRENQLEPLDTGYLIVSYSRPVLTVAKLTRRRGRKRKQIQTGSTIEFGAGALQVAKSASAARTTSKKGGSRGSHKRPQPAQRRCGNYGGTGHNARTCQKDAEEDSESNAATSYEESVEDIE
jgi:hypothetical protein